ncbi:MAG: type IV pilus twitching motility protein PilT [Ignavibacteriales bacterium]
MIEKIIEEAFNKNASDIHITFGQKPYYRIDEQILVAEEFEVCSDEIILEFLKGMLDSKELEDLMINKQIDASLDAPQTRCRINIFKQKGHFDIAIRLIDYRIRTIEELGLLTILKDIASENSGLVLITGATGMGKSTTLAAMIDYINTNFKKNVITIEDPIEYEYSIKQSIIRQREVGRDVLDFSSGLRSMLREDPDVILVGEMRDLESISAAITFAETGHLVFSTLHTRNAAETVERIVDVFPPSQQQQIRLQLSNVLTSVITQVLVPKIGGGRVACMEIMRMTTPIKNIIKNADNASKIVDEMFFDREGNGTQTMAQGLADLIIQGVIDKQTALSYCDNEDMLNRVLQGEYKFR